MNFEKGKSKNIVMIDSFFYINGSSHGKIDIVMNVHIKEETKWDTK